MKYDETITNLEKVEKSDGNSYRCWHYILNCQCDNFYDYYDQINCSAIENWKALQSKYDNEDAGAKKYANSSFFLFANGEK